nr:MAG TPA: hypothetical protein [Bacteriophage sp.]
MIDDKKIVEAALDYCAKCTDTTNRNIDLDKDECVDLYNGFKEGVKWAIKESLKDLWHDIFEEHIPRGKRVIVEYTSKGGIYYRSLKIPDDIQWVRGFSNEKTLRRWLYVDDLFPKEGDENEKG